MVDRRETFMRHHQLFDGIEGAFVLWRPGEGSISVFRRERVENGGVVCEPGEEVRNIAHEAEERADVLSVARGRPGEDLLHLGAVGRDAVARNTMTEEGEVYAEEVSLFEGTVELVRAKRVQNRLNIATVFLQVL